MDSLIFQEYLKTNDTKLLWNISKQDRYNLINEISKKLDKTKTKKSRLKLLIALDVLSDSKPYSFKNDCKFNTLKNIGSSCYLDSVLMVLLAIPNKFVSTKILDVPIKNDPTLCDMNSRIKIQTFLKDLSNSLRKDGNIEYCTNLREVLVDCPGGEDFHLSGERDAGEFLQYILSMFPDTAIARKSVVTYYTNETGKFSEKNSIKISRRVDKKSSIIRFITAFQLENENILDTQQLLKITEDSGILSGSNIVRHKDKVYKRRISVDNLEDAPYIIFSVQRKSPINGRILRVPLVPYQKLTLSDKKSFMLIGIVVYEKHHYTSYFKCNDNWYFYNDISKTPVKYIGSYSKMLKQDKRKPSPIKNGTLYFYAQINQN
jgi:ubiquitin C-terminal hydrolase